VLANRYAAALRALPDRHPDIALLNTESNPSFAASGMTPWILR
jgi:hypothetical protein